MTNASARQWLTVKEFLKVGNGSFGRSWLYQSLRTGRLPHVRVGQSRRPKILIPSDALDSLLNAHRSNGTK